MIYFKDEKIVIRDLCEKDVVNLFRCKIDKEINTIHYQYQKIQRN